MADTYTNKLLYKWYLHGRYMMRNDSLPIKIVYSLINSPYQFSSDPYFVSFYVLALSTGFIFVNTALQLEGRWPRVRVSNFPFPSRHYHF